MNIQSLGGTLSEHPGTLRQQCAGAVLMIRPAAFDYNPEAALTNKMQRPDGPTDCAARARSEFDCVFRSLQFYCISVCAVSDTDEPPIPDAVLPGGGGGGRRGGAGGL